MRFIAARAALLATVAGCLVITACGAPPRPAAVPGRSGAPAAPASPAPATPAPGTSAVPRAPADFVVLSDFDPTIRTDIRYATAHNFIGRPIAGYAQPLCLLTRQAAEALHRVQVQALARGYSLKVYDCYRPQQAVDDFIAWAKRPDDQIMKAEFYPDLAKSDLFADGYIAGPTAHSRGSTMDLTLVRVPTPTQPAYVPGAPLVSCTAPAGQRFPDSGIDMGTGFDCFDPLAHTMSSGVTAAQRGNRLLLRELMTAGGFTNYADEWWHYTLIGEPYPDSYFDFPVTRAAISS